jgi:hypothetical protein
MELEGQAQRPADDAHLFAVLEQVIDRLLTREPTRRIGRELDCKRSCGALAVTRGEQSRRIRRQVKAGSGRRMQARTFEAEVGQPPRSEPWSHGRQSGELLGKRVNGPALEEDLAADHQVRSRDRIDGRAVVGHARPSDRTEEANRIVLHRIPLEVAGDQPLPLARLLVGRSGGRASKRIHACAQGWPVLPKDGFAK